MSRWFMVAATFSGLVLPTCVLAANPALFAVKAEPAPKAFTRFEVKSEPTRIALDKARMKSLVRGDEMGLELPNGEKHDVVFDRIEEHGGGIRSTVGYLKGHGHNYRVIVTSGPDGAFGSIRGLDRDYRIIPGIGGDVLVDMVEERQLNPRINLGNDFRENPDLHDHSSELGIDGKQLAELAIRQKAGTRESGANLATPTPQATVDLMFVYTNGLAGRLGSNLVTRLYNLVTAANTAYADSEIAITLRMVSAMQVTYVDGSCADQGTALDAITPVGAGGTGAFSGVEARRNAVGADIVAFLRNGSDFGGCGLAWVATSSVAASPIYTYSVTNGCVVGCDSVFIHEVGHNMGNKHDRATAAFQSGGQADNMLTGGAYAYSFGHYYCASGVLTCNPNLPSSSGGCAAQPECTTNPTNNVGTIMSYFDPVTLKFSNPNIMCTPAGGGGVQQPCGVVGKADNALSMNNVRFLLQGIKTQQVVGATGAMQFQTDAYLATETSGTVTLTVRRVGGSNGAISVDYATQAGTAQAGSDYTHTTGTLNWANGDTSDKTIVVPILVGPGGEPSESFTVTLTNPGGAVGSFVGVPAVATVTIAPPDTFPAGCVMPPGFIKPATTPYGWSVASDRASPGTTCSLKSDVMPNASAGGAANVNKAQVQVTAKMLTGSVTFKYNALTEATYDCLRVLLDDAQRSEMGSCPFYGGFGAHGDISTWTTVTIPVTAGIRKVTWSYEKDNTVAPVGDATWIDDVVLPLAPVVLSVSKGGTGSGTVSGTGFNCGADCTETLTSNAIVTLTAAPAVGSVFAGWSGGGCSGTGTCTPSFVDDTTVTATFTANQYLLTVAKSGTGTGTVSSPSGIACGADCSETLNSGTMVTLTATAAMGSTFAGWSGGGCAMANPCMLTLTAATNVTATFDIAAVVPGAPTLSNATAGNTQATLIFAPPASDGGSPITGYSGQCQDVGAAGPTFTNLGASSPIVVTGLTNGVAYNCVVKAINSVGPGPASNQLSVTPSASPTLGIVAATSRKTHNGTPRELTINLGVPVTGAVTVEPRNASSHLVVFKFNNTVVNPGAASLTNLSCTPAMPPSATTSFGVALNEVLVTLSGVPDNCRLRVALSNVNGSTNAELAMGFLVGDVNSSGRVSAADIAAVKSRSSQMVTNDAMAKFDVTVSGTVGSAAVTQTKARAGFTLP